MPTKRIIILLFIIGIFTTISAQETLLTDSIAVDSLTTDSLPPLEATMQFDLVSYHLGAIYDNTQPTTHTFFYCNVGQKGLIIRRIETTCGCKVTQYPTDSLYYDESGQIDIAIAPCKETGDFKKGIYVYTNAGTFRLTLSGKFMQPDYSYEDYSAIPTEEEEKALSGAFSLSVNNTSTSSATEKKDKPIRQKKNKLSRKTKRLTE